MQLFINQKKKYQRVILFCGGHSGGKVNKTTLQQKSKHSKVDHDSQHSLHSKKYLYEFFYTCNSDFCFTTHFKWKEYSGISEPLCLHNRLLGKTGRQLSKLSLPPLALA